MPAKTNLASIGLVWLTAIMLFIQPFATATCASCGSMRRSRICSCSSCDNDRHSCGRHCNRCKNGANSATDETVGHETESSRCPPDCPCQLRSTQPATIPTSRGLDLRELHFTVVHSIVPELEAWRTSSSGPFDDVNLRCQITAGERCAVFCRFLI